MSEARATRRAIEAVWRIESARLIGGLVRVVRDLDLAEDLASEALLAALERWPETGIPDKPGAWLMTTAKNRGLDHVRRRQMLERKHLDLAHAERAFHLPDEPGEHGDDLLRLVLVACRPWRRPQDALRLPSAWSPATPPRRSRAPSSSPSPPSSSASCGPNAPSARRRSRSRCPPDRRSPSGSPRCSRSSTSCSTKATRRPAGTTCCAPSCAPALCGSAESSPSSSRRRPSHTASSPSWSSKPRGWARAWTPWAIPSCSPIRIEADGISSSSAAVFPPSSAPSASSSALDPTPCRPPSPPTTPARDPRGHRLAAHRRPLRRAGRGHRFAGGGAQPRGRGGHGLWSGAGPGAGRHPRRGARRVPLSPVVSGASGLARQGRSIRACHRGLRARRRPRPERARPRDARPMRPPREGQRRKRSLTARARCHLFRGIPVTAISERFLVNQR